MFKVSFKGDFMKTQIFNDKATVVTLTGTCQTPDWFDEIPNAISNWYCTHPSVDIHDVWGNKGNLIMHIEVSGKAICAQEDTWNPIIGQRIAESRAKIKLYKFMHTLTHKLAVYYLNIVNGDAKWCRYPDERIMDTPVHGIIDACERYRGLMIKESHHLGKLLEES